MSADNGFVIRKNDKGEYALDMYFASADSWPDVNDPSAKTFATLEAAVKEFARMEAKAIAEGTYLCEYGLSFQLSPEDIGDEERAYLGLDASVD